MTRRSPGPPVLVFAGIVLLIVLWIGSGMVGREPAAAAPPPAQAPTVAASISEARQIDRDVILYGDLQPRHSVILRARTDGLLSEVVAQGTAVAAGDTVGRLSMDDRPARLAQAEAQLAAVQRSADASQQLANRGVRSALEVQAQQAELEAARAALQAIRTDIDNTTLRAPLAGTVAQVALDPGSYVAPGGEVLTIVDNDPLLAIVHLQQAEIAHVRPGMAARVNLIGGHSVEGRVSFVAPLADAATRTFRIEVEIPNPGRSIPAGISAEVVLTAERVPAHYISAAQVRLDAQGRMGVLAVDDGGRVQFRPIGFVAADASGVWVSGLEARERLITISHGAIAPGEVVTVRDTPAEYALPVPPEGAGQRVDAP